MAAPWDCPCGMAGLSAITMRRRHSSCTSSGCASSMVWSTQSTALPRSLARCSFPWCSPARACWWRPPSGPACRMVDRLSRLCHRRGRSGGHCNWRFHAKAQLAQLRFAGHSQRSWQSGWRHRRQSPARQHSHACTAGAPAHAPTPYCQPSLKGRPCRLAHQGWHVRSQANLVHRCVAILSGVAVGGLQLLVGGALARGAEATIALPRRRMSLAYLRSTKNVG